MIYHEAQTGSTIEEAIQNAHMIAWDQGETVVLNFNGTEVKVRQDSNLKDVKEKWHVRRSGAQGRTVYHEVFK